MRMSELDVGQMAKVLPDGEEFMVTWRDPEDRFSGVTHIKYLSGRNDDFVWDLSNPQVEVTGKGRLEVKIVRV